MGWRRKGANTGAERRQGASVREIVVLEEFQNEDANCQHSSCRWDSWGRRRCARSAEEGRAAEAGGWSVAGSAGKLERCRAKVDCDGGGLSRRQIRFQASTGAAEFCGATLARGECKLFLYEPGNGTEASGRRRSQARPVQNESCGGRVCEESIHRQRGRDQAEGR